MEKEFYEEITLTEEQRKLYEKMEYSDENIAVLSKPGTGKTEVVKYFVNHTIKDVVLLAPTGAAALLMGGQTIHSFFGLKFGVQDLSEDIKISSKFRTIVNNVDVIVLDEVSMVSPDLIDMIDLKLRTARNSILPFGGIQIIFCGDLYQLPPVIQNKEVHRYFDDIYGGIFFFNAEVLKKNMPKIYELEHVFRQNDDNFKDILNRIRVGENSLDILNVINTRVATDNIPNGVITLTPDNATVKHINNSKLATLDTQEYVYTAKIEGNVKETCFPTEKDLHLKVGAQIMMLVNDKNKRWVNGTLGIVKELGEDYIKVEINHVEHIIDKHTWVSCEHNYNYETKRLTRTPVGGFEQFPIRLAWAITIHKSQGKTLQSVILDLGNGVFEAGQLYVALSRCTNLSSLFLKIPIIASDIRVNYEVVNFMKNAEIVTLSDTATSLNYNDIDGKENNNE